MQINEKLILKLEELSNITLASEEKSRMTLDLQNVLSGIERIKEINTDGVEPYTCAAIDKVNVFRDDEVIPSFDRELILKNAPARNEEMFAAPKVME